MDRVVDVWPRRPSLRGGGGGGKGGGAMDGLVLVVHADGPSGRAVMKNGGTLFTIDLLRHARWW